MSLGGCDCPGCSSARAQVALNVEWNAISRAASTLARSAGTPTLREGRGVIHLWRLWRERRLIRQLNRRRAELEHVRARMTSWGKR